jgi:hypothetical protein
MISVNGWLLSSIFKNGTYALWMVKVDGTDAKPFRDVQSADPLGTVFSPDGKWVAYADNDIGGGVPSRNRGVYVEPFPPTGTKWQATKVGNDVVVRWAQPFLFADGQWHGRASAVLCHRFLRVACARGRVNPITIPVLGASQL